MPYEEIQVITRILAGCTSKAVEVSNKYVLHQSFVEVKHLNDFIVNYTDC